MRSAGESSTDFVELRLRELAQLDPFREIDLSLHRQQIGFADLLQIEPDRIADTRGLVGLFQPFFVRSPAICLPGERGHARELRSPR